MKWKRLLAASLSLCLMTGSLAAPLWAAPSATTAVSSVQGDGASQQELLTKIIPIVKSKIQVPERLSEFNSSLNMYDQNASVTLEWSLPQGDSTLAYESMSVTCDLSGRVLSFYHNQHSNTYTTDYARRLPTVSEANALAAAKKFVARVCPDIIDQLAAEPEQTINAYGYYGGYSFYFPRQIDGVNVRSEGVWLDFNDSMATVNSMHRTWSDEVEAQQNKADALTPEEAEQAFSEHIGLNLVYTAKYNYSKGGVSSEPYLVYKVSEKTNILLDAISGKPMESEGTDVALPTANEAVAEADMKYASGGLRPEEQKAIADLEGLLSAEELQKKLAAYTELAFEDDAVLDTFNYYTKDDSGRFYVSINWTVPVGSATAKALGVSEAEAKMYGFGNRITAVMDAKTGELLSFNRYNHSPIYTLETEEEEGLSEAELHKIAEAFLSKHKADLLAETRFYGEETLSDVRPLIQVAKEIDQRDALQAYSSWFWVRQANGLDYEMNGLSVGVDILTGKIDSFNQNWQEDISFPSADKVMSKEAAEAIFLKALQPELVYIVTANEEEGSTGFDANLYYTNDSYYGIYVEANTGSLVNQGGQIYRGEQEARFADMDGHAAQAKVEMLAKLGILAMDDENFNPSAQMTQAEFLTWLVNLDGGYYYVATSQEIYRNLQNQKIVDASESKPEAKLTAAEALKFLLRKAGHRTVAEMSGIFNTPSRIPSNLAGYAAIGSSLKLINVQSWQPSKAMTRLDAAELLYAYLARP